MQEEVTQRTIALCVEATKLSAGMLQQAMKKVLDEMKKGVTGHKTKLHHGKQTLRQLMKHNTGVSNIEITDRNIRAFSATAKKYGIDFALKKDTSGEIPRYLVFFFNAKSMPYFLAVAEKARMFWSVLSMLETPVLCFISCRRVCLPWCSLVLWPVTPFCISSNTFFMACCSIPAESFVASTQRATVRWVTSSCISHHLLFVVVGFVSLVSS